MTHSLKEARLHMILDRLSNREEVEIDEQWIEEAGEMFKQGLRKQLMPEPGQDDFRIRMSNIGRPTCQLQMQKAGEKPARMPYNHIVRMMLGDAVEAIMEVLIRAAGLNVTGGKNQVELKIGDTTIKGEDDIELDGKVFDTKSASPWAYTHKWVEGIDALKREDSFGYIPQLVGYSISQGKDPGGWIVVNKSTGEVKVVELSEYDIDIDKVKAQMERTVNIIATDQPFERCFEPVEEKFRGKPTGNKRLSTDCTFCNFMKQCWPEAVFKPQTGSKAAYPKHYWYTEYAEDAEG